MVLLQYIMPLLESDRIRMSSALRSSGTSGVVRAFAFCVLPSCKNNYLLSGAEFHLLEQVCRSCVQRSAARVFFRKWLQDHENLSGTLYYWTSTVWLYKMFHASCLLRCFLRYVLCRPMSVVVSGGFPVFHHLLSTGGCDWSTKDIDLFLTNAELLDEVGDLYRTMVLVPLRLACTVRTYKQYAGTAAVDRTSSASSSSSSVSAMSRPSAEPVASALNSLALVPFDVWIIPTLLRKWMWESRPTEHYTDDVVDISKVFLRICRNA